MFSWVGSRLLLLISIATDIYPRGRALNNFYCGAFRPMKAVTGAGAGSYLNRPIIVQRSMMMTRLPPGRWERAPWAVIRGLGMWAEVDWRSGGKE